MIVCASVWAKDEMDKESNTDCLLQVYRPRKKNRVENVWCNMKYQNLFLSFFFFFFLDNTRATNSTRSDSNYWNEENTNTAESKYVLKILSARVFLVVFDFPINSKKNSSGFRFHNTVRTRLERIRLFLFSVLISCLICTVCRISAHNWWTKYCVLDFMDDQIHWLNFWYFFFSPFAFM